MNKVLLILSFAALVAMSSCDFRSEIAKKNMEKYTSTPAPPISPTPTEAPVDPADVVTVDVNQQGDTLSVPGYNEKKTVTCTKFNRVMINGDSNTIAVKGACKQIMINGKANTVTVDSAAEFVFNGSENSLTYSRYINGQRPSVVENRPGNTIEKAKAKS